MAEEPGANESKYPLRDPLRLLGFLPGVHPSINIQKKRFFELLVKKGLVYLYDHHYDLEPDSPILRDDKENVECRDRTEPARVRVAYGLSLYISDTTRPQRTQRLSVTLVNSIVPTLSKR